MNFKHLLFLSFLIISTSIYSDVKVCYGLKTGLAISNTEHEINSINWYKKSNNILGLYEGIFLELFDHKILSAIIGFDYIQRGGKTFDVWTNELGNPIDTIYHYSHVDYVGVNLLMKIRYDFKVLTPYFSFGPSYHYLINNRSDIYSLFGTLKDDMKTSSIEIDLNVGILKNINWVSLFFEYGTLFDILPAFDNGKAIATQNSQMLSLGIIFNPKKGS